MILIVGCDGSIGSRYQMALTGMGEPYRGWDIVHEMEIDSSDCDRAIVATPTPKHLASVEDLLLCHTGIRNVLVEKPLADSVNDAMAIVSMCEQAGVDLRCVCNWRWCVPSMELAAGSHDIYYRSPSLGREDPWMNVCQPIHYAKGHTPDIGLSDLWVGSIDSTPMEYLDICMSYRHMLYHWIDGDGKMMDGSEAVDMVREAIEWQDNHPSLS